jgi:hypothetical protein
MRPRAETGSLISSHQRVPFFRSIWEKFSAMVSTPLLMPSETMNTMPRTSPFPPAAGAFVQPLSKAAAPPKPPSFIQSRLPIFISLISRN